MSDGPFYVEPAVRLEPIVLAAMAILGIPRDEAEASVREVAAEMGLELSEAGHS